MFKTLAEPKADDLNYMLLCLQSFMQKQPQPKKAFTVNYMDKLF